MQLSYSWIAQFMFFTMLYSMFTAAIIVCSHFTMSFTMLALFAVISYCILVLACWNDTILVPFFIWHFWVLIVAYWANFSLRCLIRILRRGFPWYMEWNWCCHQSVSRTGSNNWKYGRLLQWDIHPEVPDVLFFVFSYGSLLFFIIFTLIVANLFFPFSRLRHPNGNNPFWLIWTTVSNQFSTAPN